MTFKLNKTAIAAMLIGASLSACSDDDDDDDTGIVAETPVVTDPDITDPTDVTGQTGDFAFSDVAFADYDRVDRVGMPAIATALIASDDAYNAADPVNDVASEFVPEILNSLTFLHGALDDQLTGLGLTPCTVVGDGTGTCAVTAVPLIIPDTLSINTTADAGFPNGRLLTDPVIAVTLAVALLEVTGEEPPQTLLDLVGVVNPSANDVEFDANFPFLAVPF